MLRAMRKLTIIVTVGLGAIAACGGAQGGYKPGAGAEIRCYAGARDLTTASTPMLLKLTFDPKNHKVVETYTDRDHSQVKGPYDFTTVYTVAPDGTATSSNGGTAKFNVGEAFKWTGWTTHAETKSPDYTSVTDRTAVLEGDKLTYTEAVSFTLAGIPSTTSSTDNFVQFDCAQYDDKRTNLPGSTKK